jgi:DMSO/TMAO reductase YedYZ molybdopterin-dependent catalytic subunit
MNDRRVVDRRQFLLAGGTALSALLTVACNSRGPRSAQTVLSEAEDANAHVEAALFRHTSMNASKHSAIEAGNRFPSYFISRTVPVWDPAVRGAWSLEIGGMVRRPFKLTLEQLQALPSVTQRVDHFCVEGWTAVSRKTGVRVSELARLAEIGPDAKYVDFESFDSGYHESWDNDSALHPQTIVVYAQDDLPLSPAYGAPARVHSPVKLGYKNTKYLTRVMFLPRRTGGYWSDQGYEWFGGT